MKAAADTTANVPMAAQSLVGRVDAIFVTTDNTVVSAIDSVVAAANEAKIPFLMADTRASIRADHRPGVRLLPSTARSPGGGPPDPRREEAEPDPSHLPGLAPQVHLNLDAAAKIGLTFPQTVIDQASAIYYGGTLWERE